jgi:alanine-glyoxylate transaminase/serine-glyoxylate transaminase/serine-pyruvate transaminase
MPGRNFLFVPGPTNVPDRVMRAMMVAMEDHRSSKFPELTMGLFQQLKKVFKTATGQPFIFSGSGTGAWEAALTNTLSPGNKVLAPRFGQFNRLPPYALRPWSVTSKAAPGFCERFAKAASKL